jgi:hypothetical protein
MIEASDAELIDSVRLSRGMCYGTCPVYEVIFSRDGTASWHGDAFTQRLGAFEGSVAEDDFERLARFIERTGFFGWNDEYVAPVTDNPTYELEVVRAGHGKRVVQYATDEPPDFWVIAALVDAIAATIDWTERRDS